MYDLAAIRAIEGRTEDAMSLLQQAIVSGWMEYRLTLMDPRFETLRADPRFRQMLEDLSVHVAELREEAKRLCETPLRVADYPVRPPQREAIISPVARTGKALDSDGLGAVYPGGARKVNR